MTDNNCMHCVYVRVGVVATYDARLPTEETVYNWFWVRSKQDTLATRHSKRRKKGAQSMTVPMQLQYSIVQENSIPTSVAQAMVPPHPHLP